MTLWSSMVITGTRHQIFFSGDTGLTTQYKEIAERFGSFDLVMLEVGAHHPFWGDIHLGPNNALTAHKFLGSGALMPVHWGTFSLALHAWHERPETLLRLSTEKPIQLFMPALGTPAEPAEDRPVETWWRTPQLLREGPKPPVAETARLSRKLPWPLD